MRKNVAIAGIIILVVGAALLGAGIFGALGTTKIVSNFNQTQTGEYVSNEIAINTTSTVVVTSPATTGGMVPAQDLSFVNSTNVGLYVIPYNLTAAGTHVYDRLIGNYYYVVFSSTQPTTQIVITSGAKGYGLLTLGGFGLVIIGIIVAVAGAVMKTRRQQV